MHGSQGTAYEYKVHFIITINIILSRGIVSDYGLDYRGSIPDRGR
jgi:hypothetical protein